MNNFRNDPIPRPTLARLVRERLDGLGLTRAEAAELVDDAPTQMSRLYTGNVHEFSAERLVKMLLRAGCDMRLEVRVPRNGESGRRGKFTVTKVQT